ncbi:MAG: hypothetical protein ACOY4K_01950 [Pseudomonadota bacterium]
MFRSLLVALAIVLSPVAAAAADRGLSSPSEADAFLQQVMAELSAYAGPHQSLVSDAEDLVLFGIDGVGKAAEMADRRARSREVKEWADAWEAEARAKIAAIRARQTQLPPFPEATLQRIAELDPSFRPRMAGFRHIGDETRESVDLCIAYLEGLVGSVRRAAGGDGDALASVAAHVMYGTRLVVEAENALLEVSIAVTGDEHPQNALARSSLHSNLAILALYDLIMADLAEEPRDAVATVATMREEAARSRAAALDIKRLAARMSAQFDGAPASMESIQKIRTALATYNDSSAVEVKVADLLEAAAAKVAAGKVPLDVMETDFAGLDPLFTQRVELQRRRIKLFSGQ